MDFSDKKFWSAILAVIGLIVMVIERQYGNAVFDLASWFASSQPNPQVAPTQDSQPASQVSSVPQTPPTPAPQTDANRYVMKSSDTFWGMDGAQSVRTIQLSQGSEVIYIGQDLQDANFSQVTETNNDGSTLKGVVATESIGPKDGCYVVTSDDHIWEPAPDGSKMNQTDAITAGTEIQFLSIDQQASEYANIALLDSGGHQLKQAVILASSIKPKPGCYIVKTDDYLWIVTDTSRADQLAQGTEVEYLGQDPQNANYALVAEIDSNGTVIQRGRVLARSIGPRPEGFAGTYFDPRPASPPQHSFAQPHVTNVPNEARMPHYGFFQQRYAPTRPYLTGYRFRSEPRFTPVGRTVVAGPRGRR